MLSNGDCFVLSPANNDVLLVHSGYWPGVARLPAVLHAGGARVTVIAPRGSDVLATRYSAESIAVPHGMTEIIDALRQHLRTRTYRLVILADDPLLNALADRSRTEPWIRKILPLPDERSLDMLASKIAFLDRCRQSGLPIARSEHVTDCNAAMRAAAGMSYPVMLKLPTGHGGVGVKRIDSPAEMQCAFDAFARGKTITVERFIAGKVVGCEVLFDHGRAVCWSAFVIVRSGAKFGASTVRMLFTHPQVRDIVERLGALTKLHGFGVLDFIYDEVRDQLVLLELNFRPGPGTHLSGRVRKMFASGFAAVLRGEKPPGVTHGLHGKTVVLFPQDVHRAITERDPWSLIASALQGRIFADIPFDDLPLLARHLGALAGRFIRPLERLFRRRGTERVGYINAEPARWRPIELDLADTADDVREMAGVL
jgi:glutathione synthase/RimK-type ligase-like ATP-grasp enzyme